MFFGSLSLNRSGGCEPPPAQDSSGFRRHKVVTKVEEVVSKGVVAGAFAGFTLAIAVNLAKNGFGERLHPVGGKGTDPSGRLLEKDETEFDPESRFDDLDRAVGEDPVADPTETEDAYHHDVEETEECGEHQDQANIGVKGEEPVGTRASVYGVECYLDSEEGWCMVALDDEEDGEVIEVETSSPIAYTKSDEAAEEVKELATSQANDTELTGEVVPLKAIATHTHTHPNPAEDPKLVNVLQLLEHRIHMLQDSQEAQAKIQESHVKLLSTLLANLTPQSPPNKCQDILQSALHCEREDHQLAIQFWSQVAQDARAYAATAREERDEALAVVNALEVQENAGIPNEEISLQGFDGGIFIDGHVADIIDSSYHSDEPVSTDFEDVPTQDQVVTSTTSTTVVDVSTSDASVESEAVTVDSAEGGQKKKRHRIRHRKRGNKRNLQMPIPVNVYVPLRFRAPARPPPAPLPPRFQAAAAAAARGSRFMEPQLPFDQFRQAATLWSYQPSGRFRPFDMD